MKYIKKYELIYNKIFNWFKYKESDYVYIKINSIENPPLSPKLNINELEPYCKIVFINSKAASPRKWDYMVETFNPIKNKFVNLYIDEASILRKMSLEEIEDYKAKKYSIDDTNKYNL